MPILVLQEGSPDYAYPPIHFERNLTSGEEQTVHFMSLAFDVRKTREQLNPLAMIHTKYALLMPDSVRLSSKNLLQKILREINTRSRTRGEISNKGQQQQQQQRVTVAPDEQVRHLLQVPFAGNVKSFSSCAKLNLDLPNWTMELDARNDSTHCDMVGSLSRLMWTLIAKSLFPFSTVHAEARHINGRFGAGYHAGTLCIALSRDALRPGQDCESNGEPSYLPLLFTSSLIPFRLFLCRPVCFRNPFSRVADCLPRSTRSSDAWSYDVASSVKCTRSCR